METVKQVPHTPGPWTVRERIDLTEIEIEVLGADGATLATSSERADAPESVAKMRAELRLMASAPDLLAALRPFANLDEDGDCRGCGCVPHETDHYCGCGRPRLEVDRMVVARAALARAEGR